MDCIFSSLEARSSDIDVYQIDVIWPGDLAEHLLDLYTWSKEIADEHFPAIIENNTVDGRLVGIPCLPMLAFFIIE